MVDWYTETKRCVIWHRQGGYGATWSDHGWDGLTEEVHWRELNTTSKHSCSTGPTAVMGCKMYLAATQEQEYLDWAVKYLRLYAGCIAKISPTIYSMTMYVRIRMIPICGRSWKDKYSYNSGQPLQAAILLYKDYRQRKYLDEAYAIAESCHKKWFIPYRSKELNLLSIFSLLGTCLVQYDHVPRILWTLFYRQWP